jgi:NADPH2:quinone reductase
MRAARVHTLDGPHAMVVEEVPDATAGDDQVLIEVHRAGVTFPDALQTRGLYQFKPETPFIPGAEVAGIVRSAPEGSGISVGDRVAGFPMLGGFAELVAVPTHMVFSLPDQVSLSVGAALPMNYLTVEFALGRRGRLAIGESVLVHGAAGGIGTASIQLAKALGASVIAVTSTEEKGETALGAGADHAIRADGFKDAVKELTDGRGVDIVVDPVGGDRFTDSLRSLAPEGRLLVIGFTAGSIPEVKVNRLLLNNIEVVGVGWGAFVLPRPDEVQRQWQRLLPHLNAGKLEAPIGAEHPLDEASDAIASLEERTARGKVLVAVRD